MIIILKTILEQLLKRLGSWWKQILDLFPKKKNPSKVNPGKTNKKLDLTLQHRDPFDFILPFSIYVVLKI